MKSTLLLALALLAPPLFLVARPAAASAAPRNPDDKLKVVATIPDLADFVRQIGGERVEAHSLARGRENIHAVRILPSHLALTSRADMFVQMGLSMEHAWVPPLFRTAKNADIAIGTPGFVSVADGWEPIQVPKTVSRKYGVDLHPRGNPHFNLTPEGGRHIAEVVHAALVAKDPGSKAYYDARYEDFVARLDAAEARWKKICAQLEGVAVVEYHQDFDYFALHCGMEIAATLEPKPGVPPTPGHLAGVIQEMRDRGIRVILTAAWSNNRAVENVADKTGAKVLELPNMVDGAEGCDTWLGMMEHMHLRLAEAYGVDVED